MKSILGWFLLIYLTNLQVDSFWLLPTTPVDRTAKHQPEEESLYLKALQTHHLLCRDVEVWFSQASLEELFSFYYDNFGVSFQALSFPATVLSIPDPTLLRAYRSDRLILISPFPSLKDKALLPGTGILFCFPKNDGKDS